MAPLSAPLLALLVATLSPRQRQLPLLAAANVLISTREEAKDELRTSQQEEQETAAGVGREKHHGAAAAEEAFTPGRDEPEPESDVERAVGVVMSVMLLGAISFVMMIFYLVNNSDPDFRFYSWEIISKTISIFTSVQVFTALNRLVEHIFLKGTSESVNVAVGYAVSLAWLLILNVVIMLIACGRFSERTDVRRMMTCWSTLFAHVSGFASIAAGGVVQHLELFRSKPWCVFVVGPMHCLATFGIFAVLSKIRAVAGMNAGSRETLHLWQESVEEAEHDVAALSLSFLLVQGLRFLITGVLPDAEALEEPQHLHPLSCSLTLFGCGLGFVLLVVVTLTIRKRCRVENHSLTRALSIVQATSAMGFAWCILYTSKWELKRIIGDADPNLMEWRVVLAVTLSVSSFAFIFVLDKIADLEAEASGEEVARAINNIISGLAVLVGFSWEQSFEGAVATLASYHSHQDYSELGVALLIALIVVPAWRKYILTNVELARSMSNVTMRS